MGTGNEDDFRIRVTADDFSQDGIEGRVDLEQALRAEIDVPVFREAEMGEVAKPVRQLRQLVAGR